MSRRLIRLNAGAVCRFLQSIQDGPSTSLELAGESGLHVCTMRRYLKEMRKYDLVHVTAWEGRWPVYAWGAGKDRRRPKQTKQQIQARYRERKRAMRSWIKRDE